MTQFELTIMGMIETIIAGVITSVVSGLILEGIREARQSGSQPLERLAELFVEFVKAIVKLIAYVFTKIWEAFRS